MTLKALIFDVDGTLAETEFDGHRVAFNEAFAAAGLGWRWDLPTYRRLLAVTGGKERMLAWWRATDPPGAAAARRPHPRPVRGQDRPLCAVLNENDSHPHLE